MTLRAVPASAGPGTDGRTNGPSAMSDEGGSVKSEPWYERSRTEYALRTTGISVARVLMWRDVDENGLDSKGKPAAWRDVATFDSYNDAEHILGILMSQSGRQP
jgi:hypothetical protein